MCHSFAQGCVPVQGTKRTEVVPPPASRCLHWADSSSTFHLLRSFLSRTALPVALSSALFSFLFVFIQSFLSRFLAVNFALSILSAGYQRRLPSFVCPPFFRPTAPLRPRPRSHLALSAYHFRSRKHTSFFSAIFSDSLPFDCCSITSIQQ